jgi:hypothetical protein
MQPTNTVKTIALSMTAMAGGAWIGQADSRGDDVFITLAFLMAFSVLLGLLGPCRPWLWAPLIGTWVPLLDSVLPRLRLAPLRPGESFTFLSALAVTGLVMSVCFAGAYLGAMLGRSARRAWPGARKAQK